MSYGIIELSMLSVDELTIVTEADEVARLRLKDREAKHQAACAEELEAVTAKHKASYLADMKAIQQAFEAVCAPVLAARAVGEADAIRFTNDENGVLCLEIVRRTRVPDVAPVDAGEGPDA